MSRVTTPGTHDAGRWLAPAAAGVEALKEPGAALETGAFDALARFLRMALAALERVEGELDRRTPDEKLVRGVEIGEGTSALEITKQVLTAMGWDVTYPLLRSQLTKYLALLEKILDQQRIAGSRRDLAALRNFLAELHEQGERARVAEFHRR